MAITFCLIVGTLFIAVYLYNEFFHQKPIIPNSVEAKVVDCKLSQSRVAKRMREDNMPFEMYDITYEFTDKNGATIQDTETVRYREDVGTVKTMIYHRMRNGHKELKEIETGNPQWNAFFLVAGCIAYMLILFFYLNDRHPDFIFNLRTYGIFFALATLFIILSATSFEKFIAMKKLMNNKAQVERFNGKIVDYKQGKGKKIAAIYEYEDEGKMRRYESVVYKTKQDPIGTEKVLYFDKYTGNFISRRVAKSHQTTGIWSAMTAGFIIVLFIVKAIFEQGV